MLVDQENEPLGELEVEEGKANEIPEKYRSKSLEEVVRMHQEAERHIGKQSQEVFEVRKLADELIKQNLAPKQPTVEVEPEVDFFENPQKAVQNTIDRHPDVVKARQAAVDFNKMQMQAKLTQEHPDFVAVANDQGFVDWVKQSPVRLGLYAKADGEFDFDSANELLTTFKQLKIVKARQTDESSRQVRSQALKAATVDTGGTGESGKRVYRRADLIRLKMTDPNRYDALSDEIMQAYADGRVK